MNRRIALSVVASAAAVTVAANRAWGQTLTLYQGPAYSSTGTGYKSGSIGQQFQYMTAGNGVGVGKANNYSNGTYVSGSGLAFEISSSGAGTPGLNNAFQLLPAGNSSTGISTSSPYSINASGIAVGSSNTYNTSNNMTAPAAVMWNASGGVTVLANLGTDANGNSYGYDAAINQYNVSTGQVTAFSASGTQTGIYAVRWDATGQNISKLDPLALSSSGSSLAQPYAINSSGTVVGTATDYNSSFGSIGSRAVLWAGGGTKITVLGTLGTTNGNASTGSTSATAYAVNDNGISVGTETVYNTSNSKVGAAPVRWDASGNVTQLGTLGVNAAGGANQFNGQVNAINFAGTAVGLSAAYNSTGGSLGNRAAVWAANATVANELPNLGVSASNVTTSYAYAINTDGLAVGYALNYNSSVGFGAQGATHAVLWVPSLTTTDPSKYVAYDLNTLLNASDANASSGFILNSAYSISDTDWVSATETNIQSNATQDVLFNVSFLDPAAAPEPTSMVLLASATVLPLLGRRRRRA